MFQYIRHIINTISLRRDEAVTRLMTGNAETANPASRRDEAVTRLMTGNAETSNHADVRRVEASSLPQDINTNTSNPADVRRVEASSLPQDIDTNTANRASMRRICASIMVFAFLSLFLSFFLPQNAFSQTDTIRYVTPTGNYGSDGRSWTNAKNSVQDAIDDLREYMRQNSLTSGSVYVAAGTYVPTKSTEAIGGSMLNSSFLIYEGIHVYGGFQGTEADPTERVMANGKTWQQNLDSRPKVGISTADEVSAMWDFKYPTIFTGNHSTVNVSFAYDSIRGYYNTAYPANSYHVVWFATNGIIENVSDTLANHFMPLEVPAWVDGVTIREGNASTRNTSVREHTSYGGGAYMVANAGLYNCIVEYCSSTLRGGGVYMDGGGCMDHCYVHTCQTTGVGIVKGYGGAVCIDYDGSVKHSYLTQSSARIGGGLAICHVPGEYPWEQRVRQRYGREPVSNDSISLYSPFASACVISNNTSTAEGGGVYLDEGGSINHSTIVRNSCIGPDVMYYGRRHGRSGGVYVRNCGMMFNSVCWGNTCSVNNDIQFAAIKQKADVRDTIFVFHSGFQNHDISDWTGVQKDMVYSIASQNLPVYGTTSIYPCFDSPTEQAGIMCGTRDGSGNFTSTYPTVHPEDYPLARVWHPRSYTSLMGKGIQVTDAVQDASLWVRHAHAPLDMLGNSFEPISSLGALVRENERVAYSLVAPQAEEARRGETTPIPTLFVDPARGHEFDAENDNVFSERLHVGQSWDSPLINLGNAIDYFRKYLVDEPGGSHHYYLPELDNEGNETGNFIRADYVQVLVKEGELTTAGPGNYLGDELRTAAVRVESHMRLYGGYPMDNSGTQTTGRDPNENVTRINANITGAAGEHGYSNCSAHVIAMVNAEHAIVDGFRLYNANTHNINSTASVHAGGGVLVNNATTPAAKRIHMVGNELRNCGIAHCSSPKGAAIYVNGEFPMADGTITFAELKVVNTVIRNNTADFENETNHQLLSESHGVITANGRAYIDIDHCTIANNVGYPFKADSRKTDSDEQITCQHPEHGYHGFHGLIRVNNSIIFCNGDRRLDNRGQLGSVGQVTSVNPDGQNYVFGTYNMFDADIVLHNVDKGGQLDQPHGFFKSDFTLTTDIMPADFVPEGVTSTLSDGIATGDKRNQCIFTRTDNTATTYPVFENPSRNVGNSYDSDMPLYGGKISYRPLNLNPAVNAASDASMSGYDRSDVIPRTYGGAADLGAIENTNLPAIGTVLYVTPDGAGKRDGSSWGNAIAGNTVYQLSSVAGPALAAGDQIDSEPTCDRVLDSEGNPVLTTNEKYNGGWGRAYLTSKTESVTTTLTTDADVTETVIYTGGGPNDRTETLAPYHETKSDVTTISSGTPGGFTPGYDYLVTYPYGEISGASRSFWRANPYTGTLATYGNGSPASFIAACNANGWINNTRAERYVSGLQYAVERASETNALYHKDSVQVWVGAGKYTDYKGFVMRDTVTVLGGFPTGKYAAPGLSERQALMSDVISIPKSKPAKDFDATDYETILQISDVNPKQDNMHLNDSAVKYWDDDYAADIITDTETIQTATITRTTTYTWETASEEVTSTYIRYADMLYKAPSTNVFAKATRNRVDRNGNIISNHITMTNEVFGGLNWTAGQLVVYQFFGPAKSASNPWPDANGNKSWELAYEDRSNNVDYNVWGFDASRDVLDAGGSKIGTVPRGMLLQGVMNTMSVWQTLKNVPAGDYKLEIDLGAYYTRFVNDDSTGITFYILTSDEDTVAQQAVYCKDDKLRRYEFSFTQPADGDIIIRMMSVPGSHATDPAGNFSTSSNNWRKVCMANVHLFLLTGQNYVPSEPVDVTTVTSSSAPQVKTYALYTPTPATHRTTLRKRVLTMPDVCVPTYGGGGIGDPVVMGNAFSNDALPHTDRVKGATKALRTAATLAKQEDPHYVEYNDANWDGFTIRHGFLYDEGMAHGGGSGVNMYEGAHLRNCIVIHNMSACRNVKGGGIFCDGATSTIEGCFVLDNTSTRGTQVSQGQIFAGGMFMYEGTCFNSLFANNYSYGSAGGLGFCVGRFFNNTVAYNTATLVENGSISGGAISLATSSNPNLFVANTIIYGNNGVAIRDRNTAYGNVNPFIHCYIQSEVKQPNDATNRNVGNYGTKTGNKDNYGVNNIYINGEAPTKYNTPFEADLNPLTGEYTGNAQQYNDYRLLNKGDSSCVNHGIDEFGETFYTALLNKGKSDTDIRNSFIYQIVDTAELPQNDVAFADRVQDCQIDIGAYEYDGAKDIRPDTLSHPGIAIYYVTFDGGSPELNSIFGVESNASADSPFNAACEQKLQKVLDAAGRYKYSLLNDSYYDKDTTGTGFVAREPNKFWTVQVRLQGDESGNFDPNSTVGTDSYVPTRSTQHGSANYEDNVLDYSFIIPRGVQVLGGYKGDFFTWKHPDKPYPSLDDYASCYRDPVTAKANGWILVDERDPLTYRSSLNGSVVSSTGAEGRTYHVLTFTDYLFDLKENRQEGQDAGGYLAAYAERADAETHRAVVDGCFIVNGEAKSPDEEDSRGGGAVVTDFAHIRNCVVHNNTANGSGGGLYLMPGALVSGTILKNNSADIGGAVYIEEPAAGSGLPYAHIFCSTICHNNATTRAGGMWFDTNLRANSVAIWKNTANDFANVAGTFTMNGVGDDINYPFVNCAVEVRRIEGQGNVELSAVETEGVRWDRNESFLRHNVQYYPIEMSSTLARAGMNYSEFRLLTTKYTTLDTTDIAGVSRLRWSIPNVERWPVSTWEGDMLVCKDNDFIEIGARAINHTYEVQVDEDHMMYRLFVVHTDLLNSEAARQLQDNENTDDMSEMYRQMGSSFLNPYHRLLDAFNYIIKSRREDPEMRNAHFEIMLEAGTYLPARNAHGEQDFVRTNTFSIPEGVTLIGGIDHRAAGNAYCQAGYNDTLYSDLHIGGDGGSLTADVTVPIRLNGANLSPITLNNASTVEIRENRPTNDYNLNSVIEPWELQRQTILSGDAVSNDESTHVYHVITCFADSAQLGPLPMKFKHYDEANNTFKTYDDNEHKYVYSPDNVINEYPTDLQGGLDVDQLRKNMLEECAQSKAARSIVLDGLIITGGHASNIEQDDYDRHVYQRKSFFRGGGILVDGNWTQSFDGDPTHVPAVATPAAYNIPLVIRNCRIQNNMAAYGGAIFSNGDMHIYSSHFTQNYSQGPETELGASLIPFSAGGAIATNAYCGLANCLFDNNEARRGFYNIDVSGEEEIPYADARQGFAGVISVSEKARLRAMNCHFVRNKAVAYPSIYNFWTNDRYLDRDSIQLAVNCLFWGNEATGLIAPDGIQETIPQASIDTFNNRYRASMNGVFHYAGNDMAAFKRLTQNYDSLYLLARTYAQGLIPDTLVGKMNDTINAIRTLGDRIEGLYFCAYRDGYGLPSAKPYQITPRLLSDHRFIDGYLLKYNEIFDDPTKDDPINSDPRKKPMPLHTVHEYLAQEDYGELFSYLRGNNNVIINRKNDAVDGPNFVQPSEIPGIDGYMQNADWLLARANSTTDAGWGTMKQNVTRRVKWWENTKRDRETYPDSYKYETEAEASAADPTGEAFPVYGMEVASFRPVGEAEDALYNHFAKQHTTEFNLPLMPIGNEHYMEYTRQGADTQNEMYRISSHPKLGVENVYIDMGVYEYQYVQLELPGNEIDTVWVTPGMDVERFPDLVHDGTSWSRATTDLQGAIEILLRSHNNHDKYIMLKAGNYAPLHTILERHALFFDIPTNKLSVVLPDTAKNDMLYSVRSLNILGGWSTTSEDAPRDPHGHPSVIEMSPISGKETLNQTIVVEDMTRQTMVRTYRDDDLQRTDTVIPILFDGIRFSNIYSVADTINTLELNRLGGAAIFYREQRQRDNAGNISGTEPLYPTVEHTAGGDLEIPKLTISNCSFINNGERTADPAFRSPSVYIGQGGGTTLVVNTIFHSNAGDPVFAPIHHQAGTALDNTPNIVRIINSTSALNDGYLNLQNPLSEVHNSIIWKDNLVADTLTQLHIGNTSWQKHSATPGIADRVTQNAVFGCFGEKSGDAFGNEWLSADNLDVFYGPNFVEPDEDAATDDERLARSFRLNPAVRTMNMADTTLYRTKVFTPQYDKVAGSLLWRRSLGFKSDTIVSLRQDFDLAAKARLIGQGMERGAYECLAVLQRVLYVDPMRSVDDNSDGTSWERAFGKGQLQNAIDVASIYTYMNHALEEESRRAYVFVKGGPSNSQADLLSQSDLNILPHDGVQVYGSIATNFQDTAFHDADGYYTDAECQRFVNKVRATRPGMAAPGTSQTRISSLLTDTVADPFETGFLFDGFLFCNPLKTLSKAPVLIADQRMAVRNSIITGNTLSGTSPTTVVDLRKGLLYNSLVYGNTADADVSVGAQGLVLNTTVATDNSGQLTIDATKAADNSIVRTITANSADKNLGLPAATDTKFSQCNTKTGMFAPYLTSGNVYSLPAYLTADRPLSYQLHEKSGYINAEDTARTHLSAINSMFTPYLGYVVNYSRDLDLLANPRVIADSVDLGCYETWRAPQGSQLHATNLTNPLAGSSGHTQAEERVAYLDNYGGNRYPHTGSVVYLMKNADLVVDNDNGNPLFAGETAIRPSYVLVGEQASLYGQGNHIQLQYVAAEKRFSEQQYSMMSMPFNHNADIVYSTAYNAASDSLIQQLNPIPFTSYQYDGTKRAEMNYNFQLSNSSAWKTMTTGNRLATRGYLIDFSASADTLLRFTGFAEAGHYVYEEDGTTKTDTLYQYDNRTAGMNGETLDFTRQEDMGWNMVGLPWLVSDYATSGFSDDVDDFGYQLHIPHLFYQMDGTGEYDYVSPSNIYTSRSWDTGATMSLTKAAFMQTATMKDKEIVRFRLPVYSDSGKPLRKIVRLTSNTNNSSDIIEIFPSENADKVVQYSQGRDGVKWIADTNSQFYLMDHSLRNRISLLGAMPLEVDVPLAVSSHIAAAGSQQSDAVCTISLPEPQAFSEYSHVWLTDRRLNKIVDLKLQDYHFDNTDNPQLADNSAHRFYLRIGGLPVTDADGKRDYIIFAAEGNLYVRGLIEGDVVTVYTVSGQFVCQRTATGNELVEPLPQRSQGYVVRVNESAKTLLNL